SMGLSPRFSVFVVFASGCVARAALFPAVLAMQPKMASGCALSTHWCAKRKQRSTAAKPLNSRAGRACNQVAGLLSGFVLGLAAVAGLAAGGLSAAAAAAGAAGFASALA